MAVRAATLKKRDVCAAVQGLSTVNHGLDLGSFLASADCPSTRTTTRMQGRHHATEGQQQQQRDTAQIRDGSMTRHEKDMATRQGARTATHGADTKMQVQRSRVLTPPNRGHPTSPHPPELKPPHPTH